VRIITGFSYPLKKISGLRGLSMFESAEVDPLDTRFMYTGSIDPNRNAMSALAQGAMQDQHGFWFIIGWVLKDDTLIFNKVNLHSKESVHCHFPLCYKGEWIGRWEGNISGKGVLSLKIGEVSDSFHSQQELKRKLSIK
jgi:hypothetical protein